MIGARGIGSAAPVGTLDSIVVGYFAGTEGGMWDLSDKSTLFQEIDGTVAVGRNDRVGWANDLSGNGNHAIAINDSQRPRWLGTGYTYHENGIVERLRADMALTHPMTIVIGFQSTFASGLADTFISGVNASEGYVGVDNANHPRIWGGTAALDDDNSDIDPFTDHVFVASLNGASSFVEFDDAARVVGDPGNLDWSLVYLGGYTSQGMKLRRAFVIDRLLTDAEITMVRRWCSQSAIPLSQYVEPVSSFKDILLVDAVGDRFYRKDQTDPTREYYDTMSQAITDGLMVDNGLESYSVPVAELPNFSADTATLISGADPTADDTPGFARYLLALSAGGVITEALTIRNSTAGNRQLAGVPRSAVNGINGTSSISELRSAERPFHTAYACQDNLMDIVTNGLVGTAPTNGVLPEGVDNLIVLPYEGGASNKWNAPWQYFGFMPEKVSNSDLTELQLATILRGLKKNTNRFKDEPNVVSVDFESDQVLRRANGAQTFLGTIAEAVTEGILVSISGGRYEIPVDEIPNMRKRKNFTFFVEADPVVDDTVGGALHLFSFDSGSFNDGISLRNGNANQSELGVFARDGTILQANIFSADESAAARFQAALAFDENADPFCELIIDETSQATDPAGKVPSVQPDAITIGANWTNGGAWGGFIYHFAVVPRRPPNAEIFDIQKG